MPASNRLPARLFGLGLLCIFCAVAIYGRVLESQRTRPFGRFNEPQMMERAQAIRASLMTGETPLAASLRRCYRENRDGVQHPFWIVDYTDDTGDSVLRLGFDGLSGDLHYASICPATKSISLLQFARPGRLNSADTVLKLSRDWIYAMSLAPKMGPWNVTRLPKQIGSVWNVVWQCHDQKLNFSFEQKTGRLIMAQVRA